MSSASTSRNLVLCFDGTSFGFSSSTISNLPKLYSILSVNPAEQLCYYQEGVGTYGTRGVIGKLLDEAIAWDLDVHVKAGYQFLMRTYRPGDKIFLFGFSRGAFTARAVAGMIEKVGLLQFGNDQSISMAYDIYSGKDNALFNGGSLAAAFKKTFSRTVGIHFIGVWDTVVSVGAIIPRTLPFASGASHIKTFRHCLSLDERRARFSPQFWTGSDTPDISEAESGVQPTSVKEIWMIGSHGDNGGGTTECDGDVTPLLSYSSFRWMCKEAEAAGLKFDLKATLESGIYSPFVAEARATTAKSLDDDQILLKTLITLAAKCPLPILLPSSSSDTVLSFYSDSLAPRHDSLAWSTVGGTGFKTWISHKAMWTLWWLIEITPAIRMDWDDEGKVRTWRIRSNFGRPRTLTKNPVFHNSVLVRQSAAIGDFTSNDGDAVCEYLPYMPVAQFAKGQSGADVTYSD